MNDNDNCVYLDRKPGLYLKQSPGRGRGLFCASDIKEGEELENTPALILNEKGHEAISETLVFDYVFETGEIDEDMQEEHGIEDMGGSSCIVMGIGSYCNHDLEPNAQIRYDQQGDTLYYALVALKDIPAGTEICTSYGETWLKDHGVEIAETEETDVAPLLKTA